MNYSTTALCTGFVWLFVICFVWVLEKRFKWFCLLEHLSCASFVSGLHHHQTFMQHERIIVKFCLMGSLLWLSTHGNWMSILWLSHSVVYYVSKVKFIVNSVDVIKIVKNKTCIVGAANKCFLCIFNVWYWYWTLFEHTLTINANW